MTHQVIAGGCSSCGMPHGPMISCEEFAKRFASVQAKRPIAERYAAQEASAANLPIRTVS